MENKQIIKTNRGWVDLSNLTYKNNHIDWKMSIGKTVDFQYDDIVSTLTITEGTSDSHYVYIDVDGYVENHRINVSQIRHCEFGTIVKKITPDFRYQIGDCVNGIIILNRRKNARGRKFYDYRCTKDGYTGYIREDHLNEGSGCPVCAGYTVLAGYNDIATTNPDIASLFLNQSDTYKYSEHSNKQVYFKCPRCGNIIYARIYSVSNCGLSCKKCGDGISYPNKFIYNFVEQLSKLDNKNFNFKPETMFDWSMNYKNENRNLSGNKIYDMYIYDYDCDIIIENQGEYHYKENFASIKYNRTLEEV